MTRRLAAVALVGVFCSSVSVFAQTARTGSVGFGRTDFLGGRPAMSARGARNASIALLSVDTGEVRTLIEGG